jgi:choline-sulfatase
MPKIPNLLILIADQFSRDALGCYGSSVVRTPNLDALAGRGVCFEKGYTNCPICVPARASLATGLYVHQTGHWDNAFPYTGDPRGWGHQLKATGHRYDSIGKLHFRSSDDDNGFSAERIPLHVHGDGDLLGSLRENPPVRHKRREITGAGPGKSSYLSYDCEIAETVVGWLRTHRTDPQPWALFASFVCPHPPYICPPDLFDYYNGLDLPKPPQWREADWPMHPAVRWFREKFDSDRPFDPEAIHRMNAAYYGACEAVDNRVGEILGSLADLDLEDSTRILFISDHGECLGARGMFGKFTMYEESAGVPMILAGPELPKGKRVTTPVSLIDVGPTVLEQFEQEGSEKLPGRCLAQIAEEPEAHRVVFSEYHALHSRAGAYMVTDGRWKLIEHVGMAAQLFDLETDPQESVDLIDQVAAAGERVRLEAALREVLEPEAVDRQAKADQWARIEAFGGEDAVRARGSFFNSPVPGEDAAFEH